MDTSSQIAGDKHIVVLFDGVCNLCNGTVQFIIKRDPEGIFKFASLQSSYGQSQLSRFHIPATELHSIVVIENDVCYQKSDAALKIARRLRGGWKLISAGRIIPKFIRDAMYTLIASNRYRVFGKQGSCWLPTPELRDRFIQ